MGLNSAGTVPQIDKVFRIAKPMRKAFWTKRFAARWGELAGVAKGGVSAVGRIEEVAGGVDKKLLGTRATLQKPRPDWHEGRSGLGRDR
jgi:hypothetical protein